jgi:integrase-like protein/homeodomain-containing protein
MILQLLDEAQAAGARLRPACAVVGMSARTVERWRARAGGDDRRLGPHRRPGNALSEAEQALVVSVLSSPAYRGVSPKQLVPQLADEDVYLASESTMYRLRRRYGLAKARRHGGQPHATRASVVHRASGPNQVWSWDITYLPTVVRGTFLYLYLVLDVWSRRIVGWEVCERESADEAASLIQRICAVAGIDPKGLVLHSDNGKPMRGATMISTLQWLGIVPSFSRRTRACPLSASRPLAAGSHASSSGTTSSTATAASAT